MLDPKASLPDAPIAKIFPSPDSDTLVPEKSPPASPSMSFPICVHAPDMFL